MQDIILAVVVPLAERTVKPMWRQLSYVFHYKTNIEHLNGQVQKLVHKRGGVELEVIPAREALLSIDPGVDRWLSEVHKVLEENDNETCFSEENVAAMATCCNGWLPNLKGRYALGMKAKMMTKKVNNLLAENLVTIAHPGPHAEVEFQPTEDSAQLGNSFHEGASTSGALILEKPPTCEGKNINFDSRRPTFEEVMEALRGNQINPIIICGMGGIGKTTLMGQVVEKAREESLFDEYTQATVNDPLDKAPDVIQIQGELAEYLGKKILEDERERGPRASKLRQRLSQGSQKILVMLDNVSTTTPDFLWDIGIPPSCKLLVTTRQQDLFKDINTRKNFPVHGLPNADAWSLFKKTAGSSIETDRELQVVAEKVLKKFGGLPIAISTVGTALKGESIAIWKNALRELEKANPENVPGVIEHVYGKIKFSYECLPSQQAKLCVLLCCLFRESSDISMEYLFRMGFGLGVFRGTDSTVEGRDCMEALVQTLTSRFLLLESDKKECVRMHDVVRDVALYMASEEFVEKRINSVGKRIVVSKTAESLNLMDWQKNTCISLRINERYELLMIYINAQNEVEPPPTVFNGLEDLKVLVLVLEMELLLPSLGVLRNLRTLCLQCSEGDVSVIGELRTLMILELRCRTEQLPANFRNLSNLRLLDLSYCKKLKTIPSGVISSLSRLEELYMWSFKNWVVEKLASTETTNSISQLESEEEVDYKKTKTTLETWKSLNRLAVEQPAKVGKKFKEEVQSLRAKDTRWAKSMNWNTGILAELLSLSHLTSLQVRLPPVDELLTSTMFNKLTRFKISIGWEQAEQHVIFSALEHDGNYLRVQDLDAGAVVVGAGISLLLENSNILEFKSICGSQLPNACFAKTKSLEVEECDALEYLIDTTLVKAATAHCSSGVFPILNSLRISDAIRLKEIFHGELPRGSLEELQSLYLSSLPALTYIWKRTSRSEWGLLTNILGLVQVLQIEKCSSLEEIVAFEDDVEEITFLSLTKLTLSHLPNFTGITKSISKWSKTLPMHISRKHNDFIFDTKVHFPVLKNLYIECMNLREIWNGQIAAESFCELHFLVVTGCDRLLHLIPTHMQTRLQKLEIIQVRNCSSLGEIFESGRLIFNDGGDAAAITISESGNQGVLINRMMPLKQSSQAFQNLIEITIYGCGRLRTLLSPSITRGLVKLRKLEIQYCENIEEIVAAAEDEETEDDNMFPQLCVLTLTCLVNLRSFSRGKYNFRWSLMECITIVGCCNMKSFCLGSVRTPREMRMVVGGAGENLEQELRTSRREM